MYLSKVFIPLQQAKNPYQLHQALWRLFPNRDELQRDFLFRLEQQQKSVGFHILMQSQIKPQMQENTPQIMTQRNYDLALQPSQRLRFRLRANPIKTIKDSSKGTVTKKGKVFTKTVRVPLLQEEQQQAWLERKFEDFAQLEALLIQSEPIIYFRKSKEQRSGKIQSVLFDGVCSITDANALKQAMVEGIGPAKAFGCGLLSVARV